MMLKIGPPTWVSSDTRWTNSSGADDAYRASEKARLNSEKVDGGCDNVCIASRNFWRADLRMKDLTSSMLCMVCNYASLLPKVVHVLFNFIFECLHRTKRLIFGPCKHLSYQLLKISVIAKLKIVFCLCMIAVRKLDLISGL